VWRARAILIGLFALFFVPIVVSMVLVISKPGWTPFGSINKGELIQPPIELSLAGAVGMEDGQPLSRSADGHWMFAHVSMGECGEACERALVAMRQARLALGKDADRVERVWLMTGDPTRVSMSRLLPAFPGLKPYGIAASAARRFPRASGDAIFVIDPAGLLILRYEGAESASDILKDMKRLLKISKQG